MPSAFGAVALSGRDSCAHGGVTPGCPNRGVGGSALGLRRV
jgi:hypothetical protein